MKKYGRFILIISFCGISLANNTEKIEETNTKSVPTQTIIQNINPISDSTKDLNDIQLSFCNDTVSKVTTPALSLNMRPWQKKEICMVLSNNWDKTLNILLWFSYWTLNKDGTIMCDADMSNNNTFSKYITQNSTTWIIVAAHKNVIKKVNYVASKYKSGIMFWCAAYKINKKESIETGKMFLIIVRKSAPISINIRWPIYQFWRRDDLKNDTIKNPSILKIIISILGILLIINIFNTTKKCNVQNKKKDKIQKHKSVEEIKK